MKAILTYYGGKQKLIKAILPLIPTHKLYCEPFIGGGAIFFAKPPSRIEVINDINGEIINFYRVVRTQFKKLQKKIQVTLHSRKSHAFATFIFKNPDLFSPVERAWATYVSAMQSFSSILGSTFGCGKTENTTERKFFNKKKNFIAEFADRLEIVQIECRDALEVISARDTKDSFFYLDPPYFNSNCAGYEGYTENDFERLLILLSKIKGKFLLSSYPSDILKKYTRKNKWFTKKIETALCVPGAKKNGRRKTEVLTGNYRI